MIYDFQRVLCLRLLAWAALSLLAGAVCWLAGDPFWRAFGLQAVVWGLVDALIGLLGQRGLGQKLAGAFDPDAAAHKARSLRRILALNAGLDLIYIAGGAALALTLGRADAFSSGTGWGIVLQGVFLLFFDSLHALGVPAEMTLPEWNLFDTPDNAPFHLPGGRPAALLVHGFPDSPAAVRDLAGPLQAQGWTVSALLLPGYGAELSSLYQRRTGEWVDAIASEVARLQSEHTPVLLVGFSMGAGLCIPAAVRSQPDALVLLAPFWWREPLPLRLSYTLLRLVGPPALPVGRFIHLDNPELRQGMLQLAPGLSADDPRLRAVVKSLWVPFAFLEQFRQLGRLVQTNAPHWHGPTLVLQGLSDPVVRPALTRRLLRLLGSPAIYHEVPGGHNLNLAAHPSAARVAAELSTFAQHQLANPPAPVENGSGTNP